MQIRSDAAGRPKQRRYTFGDHWNTCHVWAQQNTETYSGQSADGRINFEGPVIYSYGDHFPMARFIGSYDGRRVILVNADKYSVSTSQHQGAVMAALKNEDITIRLPIKFLHNAGLTKRERSKAQEVLFEHVALCEQCTWGTAPNHYNRMRAKDARDELAAFRAIYKPRVKVPRNVIAWSRKRAATFARKEFLRTVRQAYETAKRYKRANPTLAAPDQEDMARSAWDCSQRIAEYKREAKGLYSARLVLGKHGAAKSSISVLSNAIALLKQGRAPWEQLLVAAEYRERRDNDLDDIKHIMTGGRNRYMGLPDLGHLWSVAIREGMADAAAEIGRLVQIKAWEKEVPETYKRASFDRDELTPEQWEAGQGEAYRYSLGQTVYVRRKGEKLQTSKGAECPWNHAVAAFVVAQSCRHLSQTYQTNGHSIRVGNFRVDRIETDGTLVAGCHTIAFDNMLRLAVKEIPDRVQAPYPLPVLYDSDEAVYSRAHLTMNEFAETYATGV